MKYEDLLGIGMICVVCGEAIDFSVLTSTVTGEYYFEIASCEHCLSGEFQRGLETWDRGADKPRGESEEFKPFLKEQPRPYDLSWVEQKKQDDAKIKRAVDILDIASGDTDLETIDYAECPMIHAMHILLGIA